jgi:beta-lactamase regulating signal transducer with metallopeptidase domain
MTISLGGFPVLIEVFWKSGIVLGLALCIGALLRGRSADVRRLVLSTAIVALFVAALALPVMPRWTAVTLPVFDLRAQPVRSLAVPVAVPVTGAVRPPANSRIARPGAIPLIWFMGTALLLTRFAVGLRGLHRLRAASEPVPDADLLTRSARHRRVALLQSDSIAAPLTWGWIRPVILVPAAFEQLPEESRKAILSHERAHIQGHDFLLRCLAEIACSAIWFQPLVWIVRRQLREEQELACDNRVLAEGGKPSAYARLLLEWNARPRADILIAAGMAHRSSLKRRLYALLDRDQRRDSVPAWGALAAGFLALAAALPLAALGFTPALPVPRPTAPRPTLRPSAPPPRMTMKRILLTQALPTPTPIPAQAPAPQPLPRFVSTTKLVIVDVSVRDRSGTVIEGLGPDDLVLNEDGRPQTIKVFEYRRVDDPAPGVSGYYVLGYYTSNPTDGVYRKITITRNNASAAYVVDFRPGYYAEKALGAHSEDSAEGDQ